MFDLKKWTVAPLLLGAVLACKSEEPVQRTDYFGSIASDLNSMQSELKDGIYQIDSVTKSLNRFAAAEGDLRQPLADLQNSIVDLDGTTARIRSMGQEVKTKQAAFQTSWSEEIQAIESANVRNTAEQGRAEVEGSFSSLDKESEALRNRYSEWESKVRLIQTSLEANLSPANQQAMLVKIKEVNDLTPKLKEGIRSLSNTLATLSDSMKTAI
jgi:chromosome segregation ATPase